jgi:hypothetical protein
MALLRLLTTDVMIIEIFVLKRFAQNLAFLLKIQMIFAKFASLNWFLRKTPFFSPNIGENRRKL